MKASIYYKSCAKDVQNPDCYSVLKHDVVQSSGENEALKEESL